MPLTRIFVFWVLFASVPAFAQSPAFSRFTDDLPRLLETDAGTVLAYGMYVDFASKVCARVPGIAAQEVQEKSAAWRRRNDAFIMAASAAIREIADRHLPEGGVTLRESYLQMVLRRTASAANQRLVNSLGGATLDNNLVPPTERCLREASALQDSRADIQNTPEFTGALAPYMERKRLPR
jgi:hypothetical protein